MHDSCIQKILGVFKPSERSRRFAPKTADVLETVADYLQFLRLELALFLIVVVNFAVFLLAF